MAREWLPQKGYKPPSQDCCRQEDIVFYQPPVVV
jgi:hypothetical protein